MIEASIMREMRSIISLFVEYCGFHPEDRNRVGDRLPAVLIRKADEEEADVLNIKGSITKYVYYQLILITDYNRFDEIYELKTQLENAIANMSVSRISGLFCVQWAGVQEPSAEESADAFSFDRATIAGNRKVTVINFR